MDWIQKSKCRIPERRDETSKATAELRPSPRAAFDRATPSATLALMLGGLAVVAAGCNLLLPLAVLSNPKKKVAAEYDKLSNKSVLVLVWADQATLFDYPHIRMELATYVGDKIAAQVPSVKLIDPVRLADYQERTLDTALDPERAGRHFEADAVVYLELLKFQVRDPNAPDILRAQIESSVAVYNLEADPDERRVSRLSPAAVTYPEQGGVMFTTSNSIQVRQGAYVEFAEVVARKFYEHEEEY